MIRKKIDYKISIIVEIITFLIMCYATFIILIQGKTFPQESIPEMISNLIVIVSGLLFICTMNLKRSVKQSYINKELEKQIKEGE